MMMLFTANAFKWIIFYISSKSLCYGKSYESLAEKRNAKSFNPSDVVMTLVSRNLVRCFAASQQIPGCKTVAFNNSECYILKESATLTTDKSTDGFEILQTSMTERCNMISGLPTCRVDFKFEAIDKIQQPSGFNEGTCNIVINDDIIPSFCYFGNGLWIVIQQRVDDSVSFTRNWDDYVKGFGNPSGNFWIGLEQMHMLTKSNNMELMVELYTFEGEYAFAKYDFFAVGDSDTKYKLNLGTYSGTAGDSFIQHNNAPFSTFDNDNDFISINCADRTKSGWWHEDCFYCNLNGRYRTGHHADEGQGINWKAYKGFYYSMKTAIMKIRITQ